MLANPMDVVKLFPVRKSKAQKQAFRDAVQSYAQGLGYECSVEKGSMGVRNLVVGDPEQAQYLITAHYDTCARMLFPNIVTPCNVFVYLAYQLAMVAVMMLVSFLVGVALGVLTMNVELGTFAAVVVYWTLLICMMVGPANPSNVNDNTSGVVTLLEIARTLPENQRHKVCFVLFDLEEAGLLGSAAYRKAHKKTTENQVVLNMDCVGDGDHILLMPSKKLKKNVEKLRPLYKCTGYFGKKSVLVRDKGFTVYPSDQGNFPYGVAIAAFHKHKWVGHYYARIHTPRDTILEETNVNILRAALITMVSSDAAQ
ncbi:MAG: DUF4910 domain-containing protein [Oscillospiraceae bacterium]|nr:DUF4910 domain-containing protein [Oscillospiraceae bacterium]